MPRTLTMLITAAVMAVALHPAGAVYAQTSTPAPQHKHYDKPAGYDADTRPGEAASPRGCRTWASTCSP